MQEIKTENLLLSIITINLNNAHGLEATLKSISDQSYKNFELIIIDGNSTDDSVNIINDFKGEIAYWISEPDNGIYNAMNKGIKHSTGSFLLMLNSGDVLKDSSVLTKVVNFGLNCDINYGDVLEIENKNLHFHKKFPEKLSFGFFYKFSLGHQSVFVKRSLHETIGLYFENNKIASDWCFFTLAICKYNCSYKHIPLTVSVCSRDGISCDPDNYELMNYERDRFLNSYFPSVLPDYLEMDLLKHELKSVEIKMKEALDNRFINRIEKAIKMLSIGMFRYSRKFKKLIIFPQEDLNKIKSEEPMVIIQQF